MRTTVDLPPAVHRRVQQLAHARGQSLSATLAELTARRLSQLDEPLVVRTDEGTTLVAFRQNSERVSDAGTSGARTRLVWDPEFNVVLADDAAAPSASTSEPAKELVE